jgi:hypothetical protein
MFRKAGGMLLSPNAGDTKNIPRDLKLNFKSSLLLGAVTRCGGLADSLQDDYGMAQVSREGFLSRLDKAAHR